MITCPWCSTSYNEFQPNCDNCGGALPKRAGDPTAAILTDGDGEIRTPNPPPLAPRQVPRDFIRRWMGADGWAVASIVFLLLGVIFAPLGLALTLGVVTIFVGLPFLLLGLLFLGVAIPLLILRYQDARRNAVILRDGQAALGRIISLEKNYNVRVNRKHPWIISYSFQVHGQEYEDRLSTLTPPRAEQQPGAPVYVLYDATDPNKNLLYPPL